jgi:Flp pilus assembly protein TadG
MIKGRDKTWVHDRQRQSVIEYVFILPLMVLFVAGIYDLGRVFYSFITITNAAREGARYGTLNPKLTQGICNAAVYEAQSSGISLNYNNIAITCDTTVTCLYSSTPAIICKENQPITVIVRYNFNKMLFRSFFPTGINIERDAEMLVP